MYIRDIYNGVSVTLRLKVPAAKQSVSASLGADCLSYVSKNPSAMFEVPLLKTSLSFSRESWYLKCGLSYSQVDFSLCVADNGLKLLILLPSSQGLRSCATTPGPPNIVNHLKNRKY